MAADAADLQVTRVYVDKAGRRRCASIQAFGKLQIVILCSTESAESAAQAGGRDLRATQVYPMGFGFAVGMQDFKGEQHNFF